VTVTGKNFFIFLHVAALAVWVGSLFSLPVLFAAHARSRDPETLSRIDHLAHVLYFWFASPSGVLTVFFGLVLIFYGVEGGWLPVKLVFVMGLVVLHLYWGKVFRDLVHDEALRSPAWYSTLAWTPLPLAVVIVGLVVAKPF
jgi:protoporphyrinogen IX oxidase